MKLKLTKKLAKELHKARVDDGMSQYALAETLGWPRSKVKRLEKGEVKTIAQVDLKEWMAACEATPPKTTVKRRKWHAKRPNGRPAAVTASRPGVGVKLTGSGAVYFTEVFSLKDRPKSGLKYYRAVLKRDVSDPANVLDLLVHVRTNRLAAQTSWTVIGLEFSQDQLPLKKGMTVEFALHSKA